MTVYFIRAGWSGPVKIGSAADVPARIAALQTAHYEELQLIRMLPGDETTERALHTHYARQHIRGEWFHFSECMLQINPADFPICPVPNAASRETDAELIKRLGGPTRLAAKLGIPAARVKKWSARGISWRDRPALLAFALRGSWT